MSPRSRGSPQKKFFSSRLGGIITQSFTNFWKLAQNPKAHGRNNIDLENQLCLYDKKNPHSFPRVCVPHKKKTTQPPRRPDQNRTRRKTDHQQEGKKTTATTTRKTHQRQTPAQRPEDKPDKKTEPATSQNHHSRKNNKANTPRTKKNTTQPLQCARGQGPPRPAIKKTEGMREVFFLSGLARRALYTLAPCAIMKSVVCVCVQ